MIIYGMSFEIGVIHNIVDSPLLYVITWQSYYNRKSVYICIVRR